MMRPTEKVLKEHLYATRCTINGRNRLHSFLLHLLLLILPMLSQDGRVEGTIEVTVNPADGALKPPGGRKSTFFIIRGSNVRRTNARDIVKAAWGINDASELDKFFYEVADEENRVELTDDKAIPESFHGNFTITVSKAPEPVVEYPNPLSQPSPTCSRSCNRNVVATAPRTRRGLQAVSVSVSTAGSLPHDSETRRNIR
jgi:hypothetical protein